MPIYWRPCLTETCTEPATDGSFCASCAAFNKDLAEIRRRALNQEIILRHLNETLMQNTVPAIRL